MSSDTYAHREKMKPLFAELGVSYGSREVPRCHYHCRVCDGCFTSLLAFDGHREGNPSGGRECTYPEKIGLRELRGICEVADPEHPVISTIYEHSRQADRARARRSQRAHW